ncbi:MAG: tetratricopeptide repeat protein [Polyangiaceae bacterium]|nr:tetratricopeptide repeat protein [Polyangiaceae bacterium]MCE7892490.1 tetratricopeptide repeat protein [Sorangiineae bacterium PRO1]MCL4750759.1 tetratricopeptide repeat protein [Myxococcales bacterium]
MVSRARALLVAACIFIGVTSLVLLPAAPVAAAPKSFGQADTAWHQGELEKAKELYEQSLAAGGLEPGDVVIAHSRVGTVKAALNDTNGALSAFRVAAAIDPNFELPAESGPKAKKLFQQARKEAQQQGGEKLSITLKAPDTVPASQGFTLETEIPPGFAVLVSEVVVAIEDPVSGKKWKRKKSAEPSLTFDFPKRVAMAGARLKVKASAVDAQNNAWTVTEGKIRVEGTRASEGGMDDEEPTPEPTKRPEKDKGNDFFAGPLPWIIGGALLVGGIVIYAVTRKPDEVSVGSPAWKK